MHQTTLDRSIDSVAEWLMICVCVCVCISILFYFYRYSSKLVISERSGHSAKCKRSVHISEITRRLYNTSQKLDWFQHVVPIITNYMERMMRAGYSQDYRMNCLRNAIAIYDKKVDDDKNEVAPLNRPSNYRKLERRQEKINKKKNWATGGKYLSPIIIPSTPNSELATRLRKIAESDKNFKFRIIEKGGQSIGNMMHSANPTASNNCNKQDCVMCSQPGGGVMCHKSNIAYEWTCREDGASYIGESSRNFYTRANEHIVKYNKNPKESFIRNHQIQKHGNSEPNFKVKVFKSFHDSLSRQVFEGVAIRRQNSESLNSKQDYYSASTYNIRKEVFHG